MRSCWAGIAVLVLVASASVVTADEGMPGQLPELGPELVTLGLALDPAQLADLEGPPLAVMVWLGDCSASLPSRRASEPV